MSRSVPATGGEIRSLASGSPDDRVDSPTLAEPAIHGHPSSSFRGQMGTIPSPRCSGGCRSLVSRRKSDHILRLFDRDGISPLSVSFTAPWQLDQHLPEHACSVSGATPDSISGGPEAKVPRPRAALRSRAPP